MGFKKLLYLFPLLLAVIVIGSLNNVIEAQEPLPASDSGSADAPSPLGDTPASAESYAGSSAVGVYYAIDEVSGNLLRIDKDTYAVSVVGPLGIVNSFGGLAYDTSTGTLYGISGRGGESLYSINTSTGAATLIGNYGLTDLFGLAYSPATDRILGSQFLTNNGNLYSLNRSTGAPTLIGALGGPRIGSLAYHTKRQQLFGLQGGVGDLWTINETTGLATLVGSDGVFVDNAGLAYNSENDILLIAEHQGNIFEIDPNTAVKTLVGTSGTEIAGLTFAPGSTPPPPCTTELSLSYGGGNLSIDLTIGTTEAAELNLYLAAMNFVFPLATGIPLPVIDPLFAVPTISFPLPPMGGVGVLVTMTTPGGGIICADWDIVNTGSPLSEGIGALRELRNSLQSVDGILSNR